MTRGEIRRLLTAHLVEQEGGTCERWHDLIGAVTISPLILGSRSNWLIRPRGTPWERGKIADAVTVMRAEHPFASFPERCA